MECAGNSKAPLVDQSIKDAEALADPATLESNAEAEAESGLISSVSAVGEDEPKPGPTCVNTMCDSGFSSPQNEANLLYEGHESDPAGLVHHEDDQAALTAVRAARSGSGESETDPAGLPRHEDDQAGPAAARAARRDSRESESVSGLGVPLPAVTLDPLLLGSPTQAEIHTAEGPTTALSEVEGHGVTAIVSTTKKEREDGELTATEDEEEASQSERLALMVASNPSTSSASTREVGNVPSTSEAGQTEPILTTPPKENGPVWPKRSSLKRRRSGDNAAGDASAPKRKKKISFAAVTAYYFPRSQGFTCIPSQGGSTLGMSLSHSHVEKYSIVEHAAEQRRIHREFLRQLKQRQNSSSSSSSATNNSSGDDSESGAEGQSSDLSDSELDTDNYYFLQPLPTRQRRALLRASGVTKIEPLEKEECRDIRSSRESCGCSCKVYCDPDVCSCAQAGIKCQVDRLNFPCGCTRDACANPSGRIEFNPVRVRTHFIHTLMRIELEANQSHQQQTTHTPDAKTEPPTATSSLACMEMEHNSHATSLVESNNFGAYDPAAWNNANPMSHDTYTYSAASVTHPHNQPPCSFSTVAAKVPGPSESLPRAHFVHFNAPSAITSEYHPNVSDVTNESSSHYANLHLLSYDCQLPVPNTLSDPSSSAAASAATITAAATAAYHPSQSRHPNPMDLFTFPANETYHSNESGQVPGGMGHGTGAIPTAAAAAAALQPASYAPFYDYNPNSGPGTAFPANYEYYDNPTYEALPKPYNALDNAPASTAYYGTRAAGVFEQVESCPAATVTGSTYGEAACFSSQYSPNGCSVSSYLACTSDLPTTELEPVAEPVFLPDGSGSKLSREDDKDSSLLCPFLAREEPKDEARGPGQNDAGESSKSDATSSSDEDGLATTENNLGTIMKETMVVSV